MGTTVGNSVIFASGVKSTALSEALNGNYFTGLEFRGSVDSNDSFQPFAISWTLLPGTYGFAFDFRQVNRPVTDPFRAPVETVNFTVDDGDGPQTFLLYQFLTEGELTSHGFVGFTGARSITTVLFSGTGGSGSDIFFVDNLWTARIVPPAVPVPAAFWLPLGGLLLLAPSRSRYRRVSRSG